MALFGNNKEEENNKKEIQRLREALQRSDERRKMVAADLGVEQKKSLDLSLQLAAATIEIEQLKTALARVRQRQKASVERANRFKARLTSTTSTNN